MHINIKEWNNIHFGHVFSVYIVYILFYYLTHYYQIQLVHINHPCAIAYFMAYVPSSYLNLVRSSKRFGIAFKWNDKQTQFAFIEIISIKLTCFLWTQHLNIIIVSSESNQKINPLDNLHFYDRQMKRNALVEMAYAKIPYGHKI